MTPAAGWSRSSMAAASTTTSPPITSSTRPTIAPASMSPRPIRRPKRRTRAMMGRERRVTMANGLLRAGALACALLTTTALTAPACAQEVSVTAFPVRQYADENGVDLLSGAFTAMSPGIRIGDEELGLAYAREVRGAFYRDTMMGTIDVSGSTYTVALGGASEIFTLSGGVYTPAEQNGSTLSVSGGTYTYIRSDGTVATFISGGRDFGNAQGIV